jgi:hypothetical protein
MQAVLNPWADKIEKQTYGGFNISFSFIILLRDTFRKFIYD